MKTCNYKMQRGGSPDQDVGKIREIINKNKLQDKNIEILFFMLLF